jgi:hypothetical protein
MVQYRAINTHAHTVCAIKIRTVVHLAVQKEETTPPPPPL